jgi:hypothetical protein
MHDLTLNQTEEKQAAEGAGIEYRQCGCHEQQQFSAGRHDPTETIS